MAVHDCPEMPELDWLEWKSEAVLMERLWQARIAKFILGDSLGKMLLLNRGHSYLTAREASYTGGRTPPLIGGWSREQQCEHRSWSRSAAAPSMPS